ncbi:hypothetical protein HRH59_08495 [Rheinheimera sp. YQF-2]|uniref:Uncharacterized protein n=1 Tax=Rheinheimera lutimaris TaxID=2740584 RepID=A0A7Y5EKZ2_9GAMM|nr:hypothetical protein [Rheinheimera lutimaris]NRQ42613.1 hypothetical protein [Rheinheimera lutimaris]
MSSRQLEDMQEEAARKNLASILGISVSELDELDWVEDTEESENGDHYSTIITFSESCPEEILSKIEGIDSNRTVYILLGEFGDDDHYHYEPDHE